MRKKTINWSLLIFLLVAIIYLPQMINYDYKKDSISFGNFVVDRIFSKHRNMESTLLDVSKNKGIGFVKPKLDLDGINKYIKIHGDGKYSLDMLAELFDQTTPKVFEEFIKLQEKPDTESKEFTKESRKIVVFLESYPNGYQDYIAQNANLKNYFFTKNSTDGKREDEMIGFNNFMYAFDLTKEKGTKNGNTYILETSSKSKFILTMDSNDFTKIISFEMENESYISNRGIPT
jgi:hypothetical protein